MEKNGITVSLTDDKKLIYFTVKVEALFKCGSCKRSWSSHMATIKIDLYKCKVDRRNCRQRCIRCTSVDEGWANPKLTEDRFKDAIERVIIKYRKREMQNDDGLVDNDGHQGNPQAPHEESLCERCMILGRPCW